jgi:CheY-like chemotaxis protein
MPIRILVVEDSRFTGSLLTEYLNFHLARLSHEPSYGARDERGYLRESGQLAHLRIPTWRPFAEPDFVAKIFPLTGLDMLIAASDGDALRAEMDRACAELFDASQPDVLVVDLALSPEETETLINAGGNVEPTPDDFSKGQSLKDPREELEVLTGFRVLNAYKSRIPVVITSYARNPLVAQHCLLNGAYAVLRKPVVDRCGETSSDPFGFDMATASHLGVDGLEKSASNNDNMRDVLVVHYLTAAAGEVLKAVSAVALRRADGYLLPEFARHLVVAVEELELHPSRESAILMVRAPWFGELMALCPQARDFATELSSILWSAVDDALSQFGAHLVNIMGGTATAMRCAYLRDLPTVTPAQLAESALHVSDLLTLDSALHEDLRHCAAVSAGITGPERTNIIEFLGERDLRLRVVAAWIPRAEAMHGILKTRRTMHYTTFAPAAEWLVGVEADLIAGDGASRRRSRKRDQNAKSEILGAFLVVERGTPVEGSPDVLLEPLSSRRTPGGAGGFDDDINVYRVSTVSTEE